MKWIPRIIRMRIHHKENKVGPFTGITRQYDSLSAGEVAERGDITTEELIKRFW